VAHVEVSPGAKHNGDDQMTHCVKGDDQMTHCMKGNDQMTHCVKTDGLTGNGYVTYVKAGLVTAGCNSCRVYNTCTLWNGALVTWSI